MTFKLLFFSEHVGYLSVIMDFFLHDNLKNHFYIKISYQLI